MLVLSRLSIVWSRCVLFFFLVRFILYGNRKGHIKTRPFFSVVLTKWKNIKCNNGRVQTTNFNLINKMYGHSYQKKKNIPRRTNKKTDRTKNHTHNVKRHVFIFKHQNLIRIRLLFYRHFMCSKERSFDRCSSFGAAWSEHLMHAHKHATVTFASCAYTRFTHIHSHTHNEWRDKIHTHTGCVFVQWC